MSRKTVTELRAGRLLASWASLTSTLCAQDLPTLEKALEVETGGLGRVSFITRLVSRIGVLKTKKEKIASLQKVLHVKNLA